MASSESVPPCYDRESEWPAHLWKCQAPDCGFVNNKKKIHESPWCADCGLHRYAPGPIYRTTAVDDSHFLLESEGPSDEGGESDKESGLGRTDDRQISVKVRIKFFRLRAEQKIQEMITAVDMAELATDKLRARQKEIAKQFSNNLYLCMKELSFTDPKDTFALLTKIVEEKDDATKNLFKLSEDVHEKECTLEETTSDFETYMDLMDGSVDLIGRLQRLAAQGSNSSGGGTDDEDVLPPPPKRFEHPKQISNSFSDVSLYLCIYIYIY